MSSALRRVRTLAHHEYRAAARSKVLVSLLTILVVVTIVSVYIGSVQYRSQLADYLTYRTAAQANGLTRVAPSPLALLTLLRGAMEYIEIIGALIAITLGYLSVSRERGNRTLPLLRSRPVTAGELTTGSVLGALGIISTLLSVTGVVAVLCLGLIGNDWVSGVQIPKLLLAYLFAAVYMGVFYCVGAMVTARSGVAATGLMVAIGIWLVVVLILPQIGDTLDADNQVPGGLFAALGLGRPAELQILTHFHLYEQVRTGLEEASLAKHFERFAFAMTDVTERYRSLSLGQLLQEKRNDIAWMVFYTAALGTGLWRSFTRQLTNPIGEQ